MDSSPRPLRRFLYVSPCFPPQSRVGALRPVKFARHLPAHGWAPVVLADLGPRDSVNPDLLEAIPETTTVIRRYQPRAEAAMEALKTRTKSAGPPKVHKRPFLARFKPSFLDNPELLPLFTEAHTIRPAVRAALKALEAHPECEAVMVNANPFAALLVGAQVARTAGLPLIQDLRDPWSVCELRRPMRPKFTQRRIEQLERDAFEAADAVILNTETSLADYRSAYGDLPPERFHCIRNHFDVGLNQLGMQPEDAAPRLPPGSLLFLGHFRRHLEGDVMMEVLRKLADRGLGDAVRFVVTGTAMPSTWAYADKLGVRHMIEQHPFVSNTAIQPILEAADVLVALNNRTRQRIMAKLYDYASTKRPVLVLADNAEIAGLCEQLDMAYFSLDDPEGAAAWIAKTVSAGRPSERDRDPRPLSSEVASERLARILENVTAT